MMIVQFVWEAIRGIPDFFRENRSLYLLTLGFVAVTFLFRLLSVIRNAPSVRPAALRFFYVLAELIGSLAVILGGVVFLRAGEIASLKPEMLNTQFFLELAAAGALYALFYWLVIARDERKRKHRIAAGDWDQYQQRDFDDDQTDKGKSFFKGLFLLGLSILGVLLGVGLVHKGPIVFGKTLGEWAFDVYAGWAINAMVLLVSLVIQLPLLLLFGNPVGDLQKQVEDGIDRAAGISEPPASDKAAEKDPPPPEKQKKKARPAWLLPTLILAGSLGLMALLWLSAGNARTEPLRTGYKGMTLEELRAAAEAGDPEAQFNLGRLYEQGLTVEQDQAQALDWYRKAADGENPEAQTRMGYLYFYGIGVEQDRTAARKWYRKAADQGSPEAQRELGMIYMTGEGAKKNYEKAMTWLKRAAEQGNPLALRDVGFLYANGMGVEEDPVQAEQWYLQAAEAGNTGVWTDLGNLYLYHLPEPDPVKAAELYTKGAQAGDKYAAFSLGELYEKGEGLARDPEQAAYWYGKAAEWGHNGAKAALERLNGT